MMTREERLYNSTFPIKTKNKQSYNHGIGYSKKDEIIQPMIDVLDKRMYDIQQKLKSELDKARLRCSTDNSYDYAYSNGIEFALDLIKNYK